MQKRKKRRGTLIVIDERGIRLVEDDKVLYKGDSLEPVLEKLGVYEMVKKLLK